ncbi:MAG: glycosyltransferase [Agriterribacter sp.]
MLSIITAVHNQLAMNKIFLQTLKEYTHNTFELIIIDNNSTDGSREFFEENGAVVIANEGNYSYPYCQNQGIKKANYNTLLFFNNDIIVSPDWDIHLLEVLGKDNYDIVSFASPDRCDNLRETKKQGRTWNRIKYPVLRLLGSSETALWLMFKLRYRNWKSFCKKMFEKYACKMSAGFSGSVIAMNRTGLEKVGYWDERMQDADFDLYMRSRKRNEEFGDLKPLSIISGVYMHHFGRLTLKSRKKPVTFSDAKNLIPFEQKWKITMRYVAQHFIKQV